LTLAFQLASVESHQASRTNQINELCHGKSGVKKIDKLNANLLHLMFSQITKQIRQGRKGIYVLNNIQVSLDCIIHSQTVVCLK